MFPRILVAEEASAVGDPGSAYSLFIHLPFSYFLLDMGSEEIKTSYLAPVLSGEKRACLIKAEVYEDDVITQLKFSKNGGYKISGRGVCEVENPDFLLVFAKSTDTTGLFLIDIEKVEGIEIGRRLMRCGVLSSPAIEVTFSDVQVPDGLCLSENFFSDKRFWKPVTRIRLYISGLLVGLSRVTHEYSLKYALERVAFGQPIAKHQAISFMIADMATNVDASRLLLWKAVYEFDKNSGSEDENVILGVRDWAIEAFIQACEVATNNSADAVQILGGHGYIKDHPIEKWMRDVKDIGNYIGKVDGLSTALHNL
jgi:alkylation response protein AidB-like acyl-CoA dehydrogenase